MRTQQTCEVKAEGAWRAVSLTEARRSYLMAVKRCPACHGQVFIAGNFTSSGSYKLQHRRTHTGCRLTSKAFSGTSSQHPQALD